MNYPLIHAESQQKFYIWDQLRLWLVQKHSIARPENAGDLPEILAGLGVVEYVQPVTESDPPLTRDDVEIQRKMRYIAESDSLFIEAEKAALISGNPPNYSKWLAKIEEIQDDLPYPTI